MLFARGRLKHSYPHSWRSKKPVIFRNTPQWFVHMDKDARATARRCACARACGDRRHALRAGRRPEPAARHDRGAARLGAVAPARLGRADRRLRRRRGQCAEGRGGQRRASWRPSRRRAPTPGSPKAPRSASSATTTNEPWHAGHGHPRRLVRFGLDPHLHAGGPARPEMAGRRLSRRLRPASRLVPFLAAGKLRHARPRALRHRRHPWLHHGRGGPQDVEVARQHGRAAGRHQAVRRRHPAPVGGDHRLLGGPAARQERPADQHRRLPQAAQHHPLDARHARP